MEENRYGEPSGMLFVSPQRSLKFMLSGGLCLDVNSSSIGDRWYLLDCFGNYHCFMAWLVSASAHRYCQPCPLIQAACGDRNLALNPPPSHSSLHSHARGECGSARCKPEHAMVKHRAVPVSVPVSAIPERQMFPPQC